MNRTLPSVRPFTLRSVDQFRPEPPPALTSDVYTRDFDEVKAMGGAASTARTVAQLDLARFHTESPAVAPYRNQRRFATVNVTLADNARLLAMMSVALADSTIGCFDAKYHYGFWRPTKRGPARRRRRQPRHGGRSAVDAGRAHAQPPRVPGRARLRERRHRRIAARVLRHQEAVVRLGQHGRVGTQKTRRYDSTDEFLRDIVDARVYGGMHYRNSGEAGVQLGRKTAQWVMRNHFEAK